VRFLSSFLLGVAVGTASCAAFPDSAPKTTVVLENDYAPVAGTPVVYDAHWFNVSFQGQPVSPGASSDPQTAVPASADNLAYVVLAFDWDPSSTTPPTNLVVLQSRSGFGVDLGETLHIPVDDAHFDGNCAAGSRLTQDQADFLTQIVFAQDFAGLTYDASTCTATPTADGGAP